MSPEPLDAVMTMTAASVMAPISEEVIFRGGLMGGIRNATRRIPVVGQFWIPAVVSSAVFVAMHDLSDPVLFSTRSGFWAPSAGWAMRPNVC